MRKICLFIFIGILSFSSLETQQTNHQIEGKSIFPCFDKDGQFIFLYEKKGKGIFIWEQEPFGQYNTQKEKLLIEGNVYSPTIKKDKEARMWVAWERRHNFSSHIYLALLEDGCLINQKKVSSGFDGENSSPSFDFDLNGKAWVTWINNLHGISRVLVKEIDGVRTWQVNSFPPVYTPKIVIDRTNAVWVFWVGLAKGQNEIFYSFFNGYEWSEILSLNRDFIYPHLTPEVCLDMNGYPWVVWSAYDGHDYEIWFSFWDGCRWSAESRITDNEGASDIFPFISFLPGNIPLIAWSRTDIESQIFIKYKDQENWSGEIKISKEERFNRNPRIAVLDNNLAIVWENASDIKFEVKKKILTFSTLIQDNDRRKITLPFPFKPLSPIKTVQNVYPNPLLDEKETIAFGDSITYGVISRTWFPDRGYVPRLEILLEDYFGQAEVLNRGMPGEQTWEGLARIDPVLQKDKSKYFLLMEGTNDMTAGIPAETAAFNVEEMVKKCIQYGVYPLVATIIPRSDALWNFVRKRTLEFNKLVRKIPSAFFLPLVDQFNSFMNYEEGYLVLFSDGAHPNELGYQFMAKTWLKKIKRIPWPPVNLKVERKINKLLFYDEPVNIITWEKNPYLSPKVQLSKYYIYRKKEEEGYQYFINIGVVDSEAYEFIDSNVNPVQIYDYSVQAEDNNGVKGPVSESVRDR